MSKVKSSKSHGKKSISKKAGRRVNKKTIARKVTKKAHTRKVTKKAVSKKVVSKKSVEKLVAYKKTTASRNSYEFSTTSSKVKSTPINRALKGVSKVIDKNFYKKQFISFLNQTDAQNIQNLLGMILTEQINLKSLEKLENESIATKVEITYNKLSLEEKIIAKHAFDDFINSQKNLNFDWCSNFDLCDTVNITKKYKKLKTKILKILKRALEPADGIVEPLLEKHPFGEGSVVLTVLNTHPYLFLMLVIFVFVTTKGIWELCNCHDHKKT